MSKIIVAIDGYSSCGKSSTAKGVAAYLNYDYVDTGAMYRAVTLYFLNNYVTLTNPKEVYEAIKNITIDFKTNELGVNQTYLNGMIVENDIRSLKVANAVSQVSAIPEVREEMVELQRKMGKRRGLVMDGRDIGTVVFPDAELKIFMTADTVIRAERRQKELFDKGEVLDLEEILFNIQNRDLIDTTRVESPLKRASEAFEIDTSFLTLDEQIEMVSVMADMIISQNARK